MDKPASDDEEFVGKTGVVTSRVGLNNAGQVMLHSRGGSQAYTAYSADDSIFQSGTRVKVVAESLPACVFVSKA